MHFGSYTLSSEFDELTDPAEVTEVVVTNCGALRP